MSLFGNPLGASGAPTSGFAANNSSTTSNNTTTIGSTANSAPAAATTLPTQISVPGKSSSKLLKDLLESAHNLPKNSNADLGSIHLTLHDLQKKTQQLRKNQTLDAANNYTKAYYLLASSGINAEEIENDLESLAVPQSKTDNTSQGIASYHTVAQQNNIDSYLSSKKDENILSAIEQSLINASKDFDQFINNNISIDWKLRREELRRSLSVSVKNNKKTSDLKGSISWNKSIPGNYNMLTVLNSRSGNLSSVKQFTREKFEAHAKIIYQLNESRLAGEFFPVALSFEELNKPNSDLKSRQISDSWKILSDLTNEKLAKINQEQKFYEMNHGDNSKELHQKIITNSKQYLEKQFFYYMDEIYTKDDQKAKEYAPANDINKVSYFIHKIIAKNNNDQFIDKTLNINGVPIWALIFYLMRSGSYTAALNLTRENKEAFDKFDKNFPVYLASFVSNNGWKLSSGLQERIISDFNQQFQFINDDSNDFDPYKYAVYKIIGKCELSKKSLPQSINLSIEDWLWFHLLIINEFDDEAASGIIFENYSLENLQSKVVSLGSQKFNSSSNNPLYLKTLLMVGLYEVAVQYTYESLNECDAVHLAIGLCYYGLLKVSSFSTLDELVVVNAKDEFEINFSRLLGSYTRSFKISDPKVASQYLILIALSKGGSSKEEIAKCHESLRELILVSREFNLLLGELNQNNGDKIPGILEKQRALIGLPSLPSFYHQIVETSAIRCEEEGRIFDALLLYQLCQEFDTVVLLINKLLSEILASTELDKSLIPYGNYENVYGEVKSSDSIDNNIFLLSQHIMKIFHNNTFILDKISAGTKQTNDLLLPIISIRETLHNKYWQQTLIEVRKLHLLPVGENDDLIEIRKLAELLSNNNLDEALVRVIPSLLIMVMTCVSQLNYHILTKRYQTAGNGRDELNKLKKIAKNCMIYAGMVQYRMPRETYSLLINLEALL